MSDLEDAVETNGSSNPVSKTPHLTRFPDTAKATIRDELQRIRLQLEALGLTEAEADVRRAIVSTCDGLGIPHYLSVRHLKDLPKE